MELVFVYGTLKKGYGNHRLLQDADFVGNFVTPPEYTMVSLGGFPGVLLEGGTRITGELYKVTEQEFSRLDRLEGYPDFYNRMQIDTDKGKAWMYFLPREEYIHLEGVEDGIW